MSRLITRLLILGLLSAVLALGMGCLGQTPTDTKTDDTTAPFTYTFAVSSTTGWQQTPLHLNKGDTFYVTYQSGSWTVDQRNYPQVGPSGYDSDTDNRVARGYKFESSLPYGTLIGRVGNGSLVTVRSLGGLCLGLGGRSLAADTGYLFLRINDSDVALEDNAGSITVAVSTKDTQPTVTLTDDQLKALAQQAAKGKAQPQDPESKVSCLRYAQRRDLKARAGGTTGAFNILYQGNDAKLDANNEPTAQLKPEIKPLKGVSDLTTVLEAGDFIVWQSNVAHATDDGHIAVVEFVEAGRVVISEANWGDGWRVLHTSYFVDRIYGYPKNLG